MGLIRNYVTQNKIGSGYFIQGAIGRVMFWDVSHNKSNMQKNSGENLFTGWWYAFLNFSQTPRSGFVFKGRPRIFSEVQKCINLLWNMVKRSHMTSFFTKHVEMLSIEALEESTFDMLPV